MAIRTKNPTTKAKLRQLEDVIQTAARWAVEEAKALLAIRDQRLYLATHETFDQYVVERWNMDRTYAYRCCQWAEVMAAVSPIGDVPKRESHARPLYGLAPDQQRDAWKLVDRRLGGRRTAAEIESVVRDYLRPKATRSVPVAATRVSGSVVVSDAVTGVRSLSDGTVALALFSPPYCDQRDGHYPGIPETRFPGYMASLMAALKSKMTDAGSVLIVAREHVRDGQISDVWLRTRLAIREIGWKECEELIWHKPDAPPTGRADRPRRAWERVMWFSPTSRPYVDLRACGRPLIESRSRLTRPRNKELPRTDGFARFKTADVARVTDVVVATVGTISANIPHPAMFPIPLADQLVRTYSPPGGLVVDPMCGSGTTLLAAKDAGRNWWGCDVVPSFVRLARRRLEGAEPHVAGRTAKTVSTPFP